MLYGSSSGSHLPPLSKGHLLISLLIQTAGPMTTLAQKPVRASAPPNAPSQSAQAVHNGSHALTPCPPPKTTPVAALLSPPRIRHNFPCISTHTSFFPLHPLTTSSSNLLLATTTTRPPALDHRHHPFSFPFPFFDLAPVLDGPFHLLAFVVLLRAAAFLLSSFRSFCFPN